MSFLTAAAESNYDKFTKRCKNGKVLSYKISFQT